MSGSVISWFAIEEVGQKIPDVSEMPYAKTLINTNINKQCQTDTCFCIETEHNRDPKDTFHIFKRMERTCTRNKDCFQPGHVYYSRHTHATTYCDVDNQFEADGRHCKNCLYTNIKNAEERSIVPTMHPERPDAFAVDFAPFGVPTVRLVSLVGH